MSETKTPILNGVCQGDFDFAGFKALNLDLSGLASGAPFSDDTALIRSSDEETALAHFKLDWTTPGVHRVFTLPNYNGQLATLGGSEHLTEKTINGLTIDDTTGSLDIANGVSLAFNGNVAIADAFNVVGGPIRFTTTEVGSNVIVPGSGTLAITSQIPTISDVAYDATTWNGNTDGATKNAIRDKIESMVAGGIPFDDDKDLLKNVSDPTKLLKISLAGLSTATTRTLSAPNKNGTIACLDDIPDTAGIIFDADQPDRTLYLAGNASFFGSFSVQGGYDVVFEATAITDLVLPEEGTLATRAGEETLTNKTINGPAINAASVLGIRSTAAAFDLRLASAEALSSTRTLTIVVGDANRSIEINGDLIFEDDFHTKGEFPILLEVTASTSLVLPVAGTLASFVAGKMAIAGTAAIITAGNGSPEGVVAAAVGSLYLRTNGSTGTSLYVKETGTNTENGWVAK